MGQRAVNVLQQSVQGVSDDSDLVVRIGVVGLHPGGDVMIIAGEWRARDLRSGDGDSAQRTQCITDHQRGEPRRHQQCCDRKHCRTDDSAGNGLVDQAQGNTDDEFVVCTGLLATHPVRAQPAKFHRAQLAVSP
jgi:hypothetical protein